MRAGFHLTLGGLLASAIVVFGQSASEAPPPGLGDPAPASASDHPTNEPAPAGDSTTVPVSSQATDELPPPSPSGDESGKKGDPVTGEGAAGTDTGSGKPPATGAKITGLQPIGEGGHEATSLPPDWANFGVEPETGFKVIVDYLTWWQKNPHALPALVIGGALSTDAAGNSVVVTTGAGDQDLAGGTGASLQYGLSSGARLTGIYWWDQCPDYGIEASAFLLGQQSLDLRVDNGPVMSRPFVNATDSANESLLIAFPGVATGSVTIHSDTRLAGAEANVLNRIIDDLIVGGYRLTGLAGIRYVDLAEGLQINSVSSYNQFPVLPQFSSFAGNQIRVMDMFNTRNQFVGIQSGLDAVLALDLGRLNFRTDLAIGVNHEQLNIQGNQLRVFPNGSSVGSVGGLLALPSNIGRHTRDQVNLVPEFNLNWFVPLGDSLELSLGYTFIYMNRVIRPGDQIDRTIDISQVPNFSSFGVRNSLNRPAANFTQGDYYAHGFSVGMVFKW